MYKRIQLIFSLVIILLFTSCFEFIEEVTFNDDGSGTIFLTLNLSRSRSKIASIMLLDSVNGYKVPSETSIRNKVKEVITKIKKTEGVYNVKSSLNFEDYIVTVSCDFDNVAVLNTIISSFSSKKDAITIKKQNHFKFNQEEKTFIRSHHFNLEKEVAKVKIKDREVLKNASYTSIYRFQSSIKTFNNNDAKIAKNKKAIFLMLNVQDIITDKKTIKNYIHLEN